MSQGHDFSIPATPTGESDYRPGWQNRPGVGWTDINETQQSAAASAKARDTFVPPSSPLGETFAGQIPVRPPDRYVIQGDWAPADPYDPAADHPRPYPA
jgi:hypothetical protein